MKKMYNFLLLSLLICFSNIQTNTEAPSTKDYLLLTQEELDNALLQAVSSNKPHGIKELLQAGANAHQTITYWETLGKGEGCWDYDVTETLFSYAVTRGYTQVVKEFLKATYNLQDLKPEETSQTVYATIYAALMTYIFQKQEPEPDNEIYDALQSAAHNGHTEIIQELLRVPGININRTLSFNQTALIKAAKQSHFRTVQALIQAKANLNYTDNDGNTALMLAIPKGRLNIVQELLKAKAYVNHANNNGDTALIIAASYGYDSEVKELIKAKANVNYANKSGETALIKAIKRHDVNTVEALLQSKQVKINQTDNDGNTSLIIAMANIQTKYIVGNKKDYNNCINSQRIIELLLNHPGANPHIANKKGISAIDLLDEYNNR